MGWTDIFKKKEQAQAQVRPMQRETPPELAVVEKVVDSYGDILAQTIGAGMSAASERVLPVPKEKLKGAIRLYLVWHITIQNHQYVDALVNGYAMLAHFVPENELPVLLACNDAIQRRDSQFLLSPQGMTAMNLHQEKVKAFNALHDEITSYVVDCNRKFHKM